MTHTIAYLITSVSLARIWETSAGGRHTLPSKLGNRTAENVQQLLVSQNEYVKGTECKETEIKSMISHKTLTKEAQKVLGAVQLRRRDIRVLLAQGVVL